MAVADVMLEVRATVVVSRLQTEPPFSERSTVPVNPLVAVTVIFDMLGNPTLTIDAVGLATIE